MAAVLNRLGNALEPAFTCTEQFGIGPSIDSTNGGTAWNDGSSVHAGFGAQSVASGTISPTANPMVLNVGQSSQSPSGSKSCSGRRTTRVASWRSAWTATPA